MAKARSIDAPFAASIDAKPGTEKAAPKASPPPAPAAIATEAVGLSDAIREGFGALPDTIDSNRDATAALKAWIVQNHPTLKDKVESPTFGSTLSQLRKKAGGIVQTRGVPSAPSSNGSTNDNNPTMQDMEKALAVCEQQLEMTPGEVLKVVKVLNSFGSGKLLENSLRALMKFRGEAES